MDDPLRVYLHDHLAGSKFAIEMLETLKEKYKDDELGAFASAMLPPIQEDRTTLEQIVERVGRISVDLKDATARFAEWASRAKLHDGEPAGIGCFEAIEALALGIRGKLALWCALAEIAETDPRVSFHDYRALADRARGQFANVEEYRLKLARRTFSRNAA
jgi:hypothetical protein